MPSTLTWLSHDTAERDRTLRLIELFKESGTVDELGIGSIRDTFADAFFPGTSVLQTRARYLLFVPWLLERTAHQSHSAATASEPTGTPMPMQSDCSSPTPSRASTSRSPATTNSRCSSARSGTRAPRTLFTARQSPT